MHIKGFKDYNETRTDLTQGNRLASITVPIGNRINPTKPNKQGSKYYKLFCQ